MRSPPGYAVDTLSSGHKMRVEPAGNRHQSTCDDDQNDKVQAEAKAVLSIGRASLKRRRARVPLFAGRLALVSAQAALKNARVMDVTIHDRTQTVEPAFRGYAAEKVASLADQFDLIRSAEIEFDRDLKKRRQPLHVVKITLHLLGHRLAALRAHETGRDQRATFDLAVDKLDGELTQLKDRVTQHP
jgi:ribosomal subunit interface protein